MIISSSRRLPALVSVAALGVFGCTVGPGYDPGLASAIKAHYAAHATEEQGNCRSPRIDTIQEARLLETTADGGDVMLVRYGYFDRHADMDANWSRLVHLSQPCGGLAERRFVLTKDGVDYRVSDMDGERRDEESRR